MDFATMKTYAATRFRDAGNVVVADWSSYLNAAYGDMLTRSTWFPWNEIHSTLTVNSGSQTVALPLDVWQLLNVFNTTDLYLMAPLEGRDEVNQVYPDLTVTGAPEHYRLVGNTLYVYPKPVQNTTLTVEYVKRPADLSAGTDLPVFPEPYHDVIVSGALALAYTDDGNVQMAGIHAADFERGIQSLMRDLLQPRNPRYYEPVDTWF